LLKDGKESDTIFFIFFFIFFLFYLIAKLGTIIMQTTLLTWLSVYKASLMIGGKYWTTQKLRKKKMNCIVLACFTVTCLWYTFEALWANTNLSFLLGKNYDIMQLLECLILIYECFHQMMENKAERLYMGGNTFNA
jgi:hypothetical protein